MFRLVIYLALLILLARALSRLWAGIVQGMREPAAGRRSSVQQHGVHMVRDPVCGTFIVPERAVTLSIGHQHLYFCSASCRDTYRARPSTA